MTIVNCVSAFAEPKAEIYVLVAIPKRFIESACREENITPYQHRSARNCLKRPRFCCRRVVAWKAEIDVTGNPLSCNHDASVLDRSIWIEEFASDNSDVWSKIGVCDEGIEPTRLR